MTPGEVATLAAGGGFVGTGLGGILVRYLVNKWIRDLDKFQNDTISNQAKAMQAIHDLRRESEGARDQLRVNGETAHRELRQHVDYQDSLIRERSHSMAGDMGILTNKVQVAQRDIEEAMHANREILELIHKLDKDIGILTAAVKKNGKHPE